MAILNYTTTIDSFKTASEIEYILMRHGAKSIVKDYDNGHITGLYFLIYRDKTPIPIRLPAKTSAALTVLTREKMENPRKQIRATMEQAERVAWRILKDWVEAQMALIDLEMASAEEVFMPYIICNGQTLFEKIEQQQFLLEAGTDDEDGNTEARLEAIK